MTDALRTPPAPPHPPLPAPPPRRGRPWWLIGVALVLVVLGGLAYMASPLTAVTVLRTAASTSRPATGPTPDTIDDTLSRQAGSLVAGYEQGWLAPVDPTNQKLLNQFRALYTRFQTLGVTGLHPEFAEGTDQCCTATVYYGVCMQTGTCPATESFLSAAGFFRYDETESIVASVTWRPTPDGRNVLTAFTIRPTAKGQAAQPLLDGTALRTRAGQRVLVAAPAELASQLPQAVRAADSAARVADRYAHWTRPTRYIVYLANRSEWKTWFGGMMNANAVAYSENDSSSTDVVVVDDAVLGQPGVGSLAQVLQHEFGHVVSLLGTTYHEDDVMTEGFAEYVEENGRPISQYYRIDDVRNWLASHQWSGNPDDLDSNLSSSDVLTDSAAYGVGYLTWRCLQNTYGSAKTIAFAGIAIHNDQSHDDAAQEALGVAWSTVTKTCGAFVRTAAGR